MWSTNRTQSEPAAWPYSAEVDRAFRRAYPAHRDEEALSERDLRSMIVNWAPGAERTPSGYYKGLSLVEGAPGVAPQRRVTKADLGL